MRLSTIRITLFTFILSLVVLWVINLQNQQGHPKQEALTPQEVYNWQSFQSTIWEISRHQPEQKTTIQTQTWQYSDASKLSQFTQPKITLVTPNNITLIQSQTGQTLNNEAIELSKNVTITQYSPNDQNSKNTTPSIILSTQNITYNATLSELISRDTITLTQENSVTTGVGLYGNLQTGSFQLMSNVQTIYQPRRP